MSNALIAPTLLTLELSRKIDTTLNVFLLQLGILPNLQGFHYLRDSIKCCACSNDFARGSTQHIYISVAQNFDVKPSCVERAIRHAICLSFDSGKIKNVNLIMKQKIFSDLYKPTNSELIALFAEKIRTEFVAYCD